MFYNLIINYIKNLNKNDILKFGLKNNINLNDKEIDYIYNTIKNKYIDLLSDNYNYIFEEGKSYIEQDKLKKIYNLYLDYRLKYINLIN